MSCYINISCYRYLILFVLQCLFLRKTFPELAAAEEGEESREEEEGEEQSDDVNEMILIP